MSVQWYQVFSVISNAIYRSSLCKIICRDRLDAGSISVTVAQHRNVSCAYDLSCYCYSCFVLLNQESSGFITLARFLKLIIAAWKHFSEICNVCRYCSVFVVYWGTLYDWIILRLKFLVLLWCLSCFCLPLYWCLFIVCFWSYTGVWYCMNVFVFWVTVSEGDIIQLFNQPIYIKGIVVDYSAFEWSMNVIISYVCIFYQVVTSSYRGNSTQRITSTRSMLSVDIDQSS